MITKEEFYKLAERVETLCEVERIIDANCPIKFWRTFTVKNDRGDTYRLCWFRNALTVSQGEFQVYIEGDIKVEVSGTWPNSAKTNIQIYSKDERVTTIIPLVFYEVVDG